MQRTRTDSPYKFLDYFERSDRAMFFGRGREIQTLLSDIVVNRLVVLFASTGTGKTSLINAGVRPRLEDLSYSTFTIRVEEDPTTSARIALREAGLGSKTEVPLSILLQSAAKKAKKPLVLFFDQFEEFFFHVREEKQRQIFVDEIAKAYYDQGSRIHLVFSMREDYYHEMDVFRDAIPSIFRKGASLRLLKLDKKQAEKAITEPAARAGVTIHSLLVTELLKELADADRIEPTRLQIVCDTLWRETTGEKILLSDYKKLGKIDQILKERLRRGINERFSDDDELRTLLSLVPELRTARDTKRIRGTGELVDTLQIKRELLDGVVAKLRDLGLIRETYGDSDEVYVEWKSDYLAREDRSATIEETVRKLLLESRLQRALEEYKTKKEVAPPALLFELQRNLEAVDLDRERAAFLFRSALARNVEPEAWYTAASKLDEEGTWRIVEKVVSRKEGTDRLTALELLPKIGTREAFAKLKDALEAPELAPTAMRALIQVDTVPAVRALRPLLSSGESVVARSVLTAFLQSTRPVVVEEAKRLERGLPRRPDRVTEESQPPPSAEPPLTKLSPGLMEDLAEKCSAGRTVVVLGWGESEGRLASRLAERYEYPHRDDPDLQRVGQFVALVSHWEQLESEIRSALREESSPTSVHRMLARMAALKPRSVVSPVESAPGQLFITAELGDGLERALHESGLDFHLLSYIPRPPRGYFRHAQPNDSLGQVIERPQTYVDLFTDELPTLLRLRGPSPSTEAEKDGVLVTEDDWLTLLTHGVPEGLPVPVRALLAKSSLLLLNVSIRHWSMRGLLTSLGDHWLRRRSWAVPGDPDPFSRAFWKDKRVENPGVDVEAFLQNLVGQLEAMSS